MARLESLSKKYDRPVEFFPNQSAPMASSFNSLNEGTLFAIRIRQNQKQNPYSAELDWQYSTAPSPKIFQQPRTYTPESSNDNKLPATWDKEVSVTTLKMCSNNSRKYVWKNDCAAASGVSVTTWTKSRCKISKLISATFRIECLKPQIIESRINLNCVGGMLKNATKLKKLYTIVVVVPFND
uniref:Uncharacterized protein n=1 Tax=Romanomermis culicivorax TaxID=13658 RepID=A0A915JM37_ROMCU